MGEQVEVFVPGRLCVLGEHTDWAGEYRVRSRCLAYGITLVCATNEGIHATATRIPQRLFRYRCVYNGVDHTFECELEPQSLRQHAQEGGFFSYVCGTASVILETFPSSQLGEGGVDIFNHTTTLPMKKGLSSSAAVCVLTAKCFDSLYNLRQDMLDIMELAYRGEMSTPSKCGRMDQCCSMGPNSIGLMYFDGDEVDLQVLHCARPLHFVVADLNSCKDTVQILRCLNECYPTPNTEAQKAFHTYVSENHTLAWHAIRAIESGDHALLGQIMGKAQQSFDLGAMHLCNELISPVLHSTLNDEDLRVLVLGMKGVGSQGDGSIQVLCESSDAQFCVLEFLKTKYSLDGITLTIPASQPVPRPLIRHPRRVRQAIIVAAGLSTRMFPASAVLKKELFPVVDGADGVCKPVLQAIVESILAAGIESCVVVCQQRDVEGFRAFFNMDVLDGPLKGRAKPEMLAMAEHVRSLGRRIRYAVQDQQLGFGHAVWCADSALDPADDEEPVLLCLGDHLFKSGPGTTRSCAAQLIDAYLGHGDASKPMIGLKLMPSDQVQAYGVAAGQRIHRISKQRRARWARGWLRSQSSLLQEVREQILSDAAETTHADTVPFGDTFMLGRIEEKPSLAVARDELRSEGLSELLQDYRLVVFGQYILPKNRSMRLLQGMIEAGEISRGEIQLTSALCKMCEQDGGMLGTVLYGEALDVGVPQAFVSSLMSFQRP